MYTKCNINEWNRRFMQPGRRACHFVCRIIGCSLCEEDVSLSAVCARKFRSRTRKCRPSQIRLLYKPPTPRHPRARVTMLICVQVCWETAKPLNEFAELADGLAAHTLPKCEPLRENRRILQHISAGNKCKSLAYVSLSQRAEVALWLTRWGRQTSKRVKKG